MHPSQALQQRMKTRTSRGALGPKPCSRSAPRCVVAAASKQQPSATSPAPKQSVVDRRTALLLAGTACLTVLPGAQAAETSPAVYDDPIDKFSIAVPSGWATGEGALAAATGFSGASGTRRTIALFPDDPSAHDVSVTVVVTNVSVEFTKLGSFGNVDTFATNLINSLDRSYLLRSKVPVMEPIQIAKLVDYSARGDAYNIEYTIQKLPGPERHLYSTVVLGSNGRYNRLYTVTAQCLAEDLPKYQVALNDTLRSFKANLLPSY